MSPVVDRPQRRIPTLAWCALGCGGCLVLGIALVAAFGFFFSRFFGRLTQPVALARAGTGPLSKVWRYNASNIDAVACGVDGARSQPVVAVLDTGISPPRVVLLNSQGRAVRGFKADYSREIAIGRRKGGMLIVCSGRTLAAYDGAGKRVWTDSSASYGGMACPVDTGSGAGDAVAVAGSGETGVRLLGPDGSQLWAARSSQHDSTMRLVGARLARGAPTSIVSVGALGSLTVFSAAGQVQRTTQPRAATDATMLSSLASGDLDGDGVDEIVACGIRVLATQAVVIAYDASGRERWRHDIGRTSVEHMPSIAIGRFGPHGRQVAVGGADGTVTLLGARGSVVGSQALGVRIKGLSALPGSVGQPDRLVVATEDDCGCYAWKPAKP